MLRSNYAGQGARTAAQGRAETAHPVRPRRRVSATTEVQRLQAELGRVRQELDDLRRATHSFVRFVL